MSGTEITQGATVVRDSGDRYSLIRRRIETDDAAAVRRWFVERLIVGGRELATESEGFSIEHEARAHANGLIDGIRFVLELTLADPTDPALWAATDAQQRQTQEDAEAPRPHLRLVTNNEDGT